MHTLKDWAISHLGIHLPNYKHKELKNGHFRFVSIKINLEIYHRETG